MRKEFLKSVKGYDIPCLNNLNGEKKALLVFHGFGSSKDSPMVMTLAEEMPKRGIGTYSFDFPAHGESPVHGEFLRISNCLDDLAEVECRVRNLIPNVEICYFGSSFGAYITLLYLATREHCGTRAFLRSAAVDMWGIFKKWMNPEIVKKLGMRGYIFLDYEYQREMKITKEFVSDLRAYDIFQLYQKNQEKLFLIHGGADEVASPKVAMRFADQFDAEIVILPKGEHRLMGKGEMETVLRCAADFFSSKN